MVAQTEVRAQTWPALRATLASEDGSEHERALGRRAETVSSVDGSATRLVAVCFHQLELPRPLYSASRGHLSLY